MDLADDAVARLNRLALVNDGSLVVVVRDLVHSAVAATPSCIAVIITFDGEDPLYAIDDRLRAGTAVVRASLRAWITPSESGHFPSQVIFLAENAYAFSGFAAVTTSVAVGSDRPSRHLVIDGDLEAAIGLVAGKQARAIDPGRTVDRAVGVLLDRGYPPAEALQELQDRAQVSGRNLAEQAQLVLRSLE